MGSVIRAAKDSKKSGLKNLSFRVASAKNFPAKDYDLYAFFDCLHELSDPVGACAHAKAALEPDGSCLLVKPFANDTLVENIDLVGRTFFYGYIVETYQSHQNRSHPRR